MSEHTQRGPFDYYLFGLNIRSEWFFPEIPIAQLQSAPHVFIRRLNDMDAAGVAHSFQGASIAIEGIAQFYVNGGREIHVHADPSAPARNVSLYLLGSAMGILLHQRGLLPLHANGVEIGGKAVAFLGASGSGKSTLAAWFHDRGYRIIADDVCVVGFEEQSGAVLNPGLPRLRLWKEALEASGREPSRFMRSYAGSDDWEKYDVPLPNNAVTATQTCLAAIYLLEKADQPSIERLNGMSAARALSENTYRGRFIAEHGSVQGHWEACLRLVRNTPIFCVSRPWSLEKFDEECERVLHHVRRIVSAV